MQKICLVIPCYNEQYRLPVNEFTESCKNSDYYYLFVNDGSTDLTINVLKQIRIGRADRICILDIKKNQGKAEAVRRGILKALEWKDFHIIGYLDADLATPLYTIHKIIAVINDNIRFAFGSRIQRIGANIQRKWYRHLLGRIFATIASKMLDIKVYDTQCGAKFFHVSIVEALFSKKFKTKWIFDLEIFFRLLQLYKNININLYSKEVPIEEWIDVKGSKLKLSHLLKIPFELLKLVNYEK